MATDNPLIGPAELRTINTLCEWIKGKELSVSDAMKMYREQYTVGLGYMIKNRIYHRFMDAAGHATSEG